MPVTIKMRRGTSTQWSNANPTLSYGEIGYDLTANRLKIGDGSTAWSNASFITQNNTDQLAEGSTSLYFTKDRAKEAVSEMVMDNVENGISVTYDTVNKRLNFDVADPTITLSGDVSGSATMTNLANVTITTTVADNSHDHTISNVTGLQGALDLKANLASPALTGTPTAPTASASVNTTQIATTAYVTTAVNNLINAAPGALDTLNELATALGNDPNFATTINNSLATKAPLVSASLTTPNIGVATGTSLTTTGQITASAASGKVIIGVDAGGSISLGRTDGVASTPYLDFNSASAAVDFDVRLQASGGNGTAGNGSLTVTGILVTEASSTTHVGFRLPHGAAPTSLTNGDIWTTTVGLYGRINGTTEQFATKTYVDAGDSAGSLSPYLFAGI